MVLGLRLFLCYDDVVSVEPCDSVGAVSEATADSVAIEGTVASGRVCFSGATVGRVREERSTGGKDVTPGGRSGSWDSMAGMGGRGARPGRFRGGRGASGGKPANDTALRSDSAPRLRLVRFGSREKFPGRGIRPGSVVAGLKVVEAGFRGLREGLIEVGSRGTVGTPV